MGIGVVALLGLLLWQRGAQVPISLQAGRVLAVGQRAGMDRPPVVFNEIAWMGTTYSAWDEWIELRNNTTDTIVLDGWRVSGGVDVALSGTISPNGFYLLERTDDTTISDIPADLIYTGGLNDTGESLTLTNQSGQVVDRVFAADGWPAGTANPDRSMERVCPLVPDSPDNWATHDESLTLGIDAGGNPVNGTPRSENTRYDLTMLSIDKRGPLAVRPGEPFTNQITIGNISPLPLGPIFCTDVLPVGVSLISQTSSLAYMGELSGTLTWQAERLEPQAVETITLQLALEGMSGTVANVVTATANGDVGVASWVGIVVPEVQIYALHPWALRGDDEAMALINVERHAVSLAGWGIGDDESGADAQISELTIEPGGVVWLADDADAFYASFGFAPDAAISGLSHTVPALSGHWPGFTNLGEQGVLYDAGGWIVDVVVYGSGTWEGVGWTGPAVSYPMAGFGNEGQILRRKGAEDSDRAIDWANDRGRGTQLYGPVYEGDVLGKRVAYPGWDLGASPVFVVTETALVTVAIAPDNAYTVFAALLAGAQESIVFQGHTFESVWLTEVLTERIAAGVAVTMLLEGGDVTNQGLWCCHQIAEAGGTVLFMHNNPSVDIFDRYTDLHAKFAIVDGHRIAVSTENPGNHAMPVDDKSNGTAGNRGLLLITDQQEVIDYVAAIHKRDCDRDHYGDIVAYGADPRYQVPVDYTAAYSTGGGGYSYMAPFSATLPAFEADRFEVVHSPETSLDLDQGLIGLVLSAGKGDAVYVEQMYERVHWGASSSDPSIDPNPRLEAYIEAARRGAAVRILLDSGFDGERRNYETAFYVLGIAKAEGLDLEVRLGNPTGRGIHNKMVLVRLGEEKYLHVGSINGSEVSSKGNRELALQVRSSALYDVVREVWDYDWAHSAGPYQTYLALVCHQYVCESDHIVIKEAGSGTEGGEWIELYNPTAAAVDVGGWRLGDAVHPNDYERLYAFPAGTVIPSGGTLVIARRAVAYERVGYASQRRPDFEWNQSNDVPNMRSTGWGEGECALGNAGDEVILIDALSRPVDVVVYGAGSYPGVLSYVDVDQVYNGNTLERRPANRDSNDCGFDFRVRYDPEPGGVTVW
jgi:uncharacterized repeat protein (TIGR01451 family)